MKRNFVIVKHLNENGPFLFLVPDGASFYDDVGTIVEVDTKRGPALGVTLCDTFVADPDVICPLFNTTMDKMRYITAKYRKTTFTIPTPTEVQNENGQPEQRDEL